MSTDEFNKGTPDSQLHLLVETTLMGVLAALYESGIVKRVNMGKVVRLFGLDDADLHDSWIDFDDPDFLIGYSKYKVKQALKFNASKQKKDVKDRFEEIQSTFNKTIH